MQAIKQTVSQKFAGLHPDHGLSRPRHGQHRAIAAVDHDDIRYQTREQAVSIFLRMKQRDAGAHEQFGTEPKACGIEHGGNDAQSGERALLFGIDDRVRQQPAYVKHQQKTGNCQRAARGQRDNPARDGKRRFERYHYQPDCRKRCNAAGIYRDDRSKAYKSQCGQCVGTFMATGAREEIDDQDRRSEPRKYANLERGRHPTNDDVDGKACQYGQTAEQTRSNKGAMAGGSQCILLRRRVHQRIHITPYWCEETHGPCHTSYPNRRVPNLAFGTLG